MAIIDDPSVYWQMKQWTGNDGTSVLTFDGNADLQADLFWLKTRNAGDLWRCYDSVRGVNIGLVPNATDAEQDISNDGLTAISSDGFTMVDGSTFGGGNYNQSSTNYIAYAWKELAGFMDIVSYTGDAAEGRNISHSLGTVPKMMIVKNRDAAVKWVVYHANNTSAPETDHLVLDTNVATADDDSTWDDTAPTSSVFRIKSSSSVNSDNVKYIAYLFGNTSISKMGTFTGNGSTSNFVYTGFKPNWVMLKWTGGTEGWSVYDTSRNSINGPNDSWFIVDGVSAENSNTDDLDMLSNGFHLNRSHDRANGSGETYIYAAFAESPLVTSGGVPATAR
tara:strand:- start:29 stop:1033 length:1005 start_codon:yes stop_codon:yes gene_type:complete